MKFIHCTFLFILISCCSFGQKLLSPKEFLGYEPGERFTRHHRVVEYFKHVADVMPNVEFEQYGETYEHRPLIYVTITSSENFKNLEQIRTDNLRRAGVVEGNASSDKKAIVWLSYNVHGNEASSLEASMLTLYDLANPANSKTQQWLKNTVVIIDPCINPDGRDRYANFYNQYGNQPPNPSGDAMEHGEPWPGGRANHYLFDLNRDWAWGTQVETQQRIKIYKKWLPHVHVDFHEQGHNNPYYFAPAAEPFHEVISPWQREFQTMIGKNNAKYFDEQGWLYFTKEVFDLYYPSYGDTYPTYSGAIGMTYEQGGGGYGGLAIKTETGDPLTLKDRVTHHYTTGLSTVEITSQNATRVADEFEKYFRENNTNPAATYKTYVIKSDNNADKVAMITKWFDAYNIRYGYAGVSRATRGFNYQTQSVTPLNVSAEDIVFNVYQPMSRFITAVFEPQSKLPDTLTYDITAWNLMYAYDMKAFALNERINPTRNYEAVKVDNANSSAKPYAYIFNYQSIYDVTLLTTLGQKGVRMRSSRKSFTTGGQSFNPGSLVITRRNNEHIRNLDSLVVAVANQLNRKIYTASTGFVEKGKDFGSDAMIYLNQPKIGVLSGPQTSSLSTGEIWHFFEQQIHYPITQLSTDYFKNISLRNYNVLIIPEGRYKLFDESLLEKISTWVSDGGKLILIGNAMNSFTGQKGFGLKKYADDEEKEAAEKLEKEQTEKEGFPRYEDVERLQLSSFISGAIYKVPIDNSHPLGFGLGNHYYSLKTNELRFAFLEHGWNVGVMKGKTRPVQGFAGFKANQSLENSLIFGVEDKGAGEVIYMADNPLFRSFWENGKLLFANAVFMVGQSSAEED
jgi:hypothetical protein